MNDQEAGPREGEPTPLEAVAREMGDPGLFPTEVQHLYKAGKVRRARRRLLKYARSERNVGRAAKQREVADDLRLWLSPISNPPGMFSWNGIGTRFIGRQQEAGDGTYVGTLWFTIAFLPIWAISSYLVLPAEKGWHFLARAPLPTAHRRSRWLPAGAVGVLAIWGGSALYAANTRTDLFVYNGFDRPLYADVNGAEKQVQARSHVVFPDLPLEPTDLKARWERDAEPFEELHVDLAGQGRATVVYNVASRGLIAISYAQYGEGTPREDRWLDAGPVLSVGERVDYSFTDPPDSVRTSSSGAVRSVLLGIDDGGQPVGVVSALIGEGRREQALAMARAELEVMPSNAVLAAVTARGVFPDDSDQQLDLLRWCLERAPDEVDLHRAYQDLRREHDPDAVRAEYDSLLESHEGSAMHHYLSARIRETGSDAELRHYRAALAIDPEYGPAFRGLGYRAVVAGRWSEALANYERFAASGPAEALEILDWRLRLGRRAGHSDDSGLRLVKEALEYDPESISLANLAAHYAVAIDPAVLDSVASGFLDTVLGLVEIAGPAAEVFGQNSYADLAITAGDLETARTRLAAVADPAERHADVALRLALSTGATEADRRLLFQIPAWFDRLTYLQSIGLELVDPEVLAGLITATSGPIQEAAQFLDDEADLLDAAALDRVAPVENLQWRAVLSWAAARRLDGVPGPDAERARRRYASTALGLALPGELPFIGR